MKDPSINAYMLFLVLVYLVQVVYEFPILIVAPWGYPPQWGLVEYDVRLKRKPLDRVHFKCKSCSSTIALLASLLKHGFTNVHLAIIGVDTRVKPNSKGDYRKTVMERYKGDFKTLIDKTIEVNEFDEVLGRRLKAYGNGDSRVSFIIIPGVGIYYGYDYRGDIDQIFLTIYSRLLGVLERSELSKAMVVLDLTHGINYQTVITLYAVELHS